MTEGKLGKLHMCSKLLMDQTFHIKSPWNKIHPGINNFSKQKYIVCLKDSI